MVIVLLINPAHLNQSGVFPSKLRAGLKNVTRATVAAMVTSEFFITK